MAPRLAAMTLLALSLTAHADSELPLNFLEYRPGFASSGQPTPNQLDQLADQGYERIVYLAFTDHETSLEGLDRHAENAGLQYVQIPVVWNAPSTTDYELFKAVMTAGRDRSTLVHCQVNFRASAFAFLYRVLEEKVPVARAKADMNRVWTPTAEWNAFLFSMLKANGIDPNCDGCDWTPWDPSTEAPSRSNRS